MRASPAGSFYGWRLLAALCAIQVATVAFPMYGGAVLNSAMARNLHLDAASAGLPISVFMLVIGLCAPLVAVALSRIGARLTIFLGCLAIAAGAAAMAWMAPSTRNAALLYGVVVGIGVAMGGILPSQTLATRWFVSRRALAISLLISTNSVGALFAPPLLDRIAAGAAIGWRGGWLLVMALALAAALIALLTIREQPADLGQQALGEGGGTSAGAGVPSGDMAPRAAMRTAAFWTIVLGTNLFTATLSTILAHGIHLVTSRGYGSLAGAFTISILVSASLAAKLAAGLLGDRYGVHRIWAAGLAISTVGLAIAAFGDGWALLYLYPAAAGLGVGVAPVCMMALIANYFGRRHFAALSSIVIATQTLTGFIAPVTAGWLFDETGDYRIVFAGLGLLALGTAAFLLLVRPPRTA